MGRLRQDGLQIIMGDIRSDEALDNALQRSAASRMVHAAAITPGPEREIREARTILDVNILGTVNAIEQAAAAEIERVLMVSSVAVYGFSPPAASGLYEEGGSAPAPAALYGISKLAGASRRRCGSARCTASIARIVRLGPLYGPWEYATGLRDALSPHRQILAAGRVGRTITLPRPMRADWLYSRDAGAGLASLLRSGTLRHELYNLGGR